MQTSEKLPAKLRAKVLTEAMKLMSQSSAVCHGLATEDGEEVSALFVFALVTFVGCDGIRAGEVPVKRRFWSYCLGVHDSYLTIQMF